MRKIAVVLFALAVMCVSGESPVGKNSGTVLLGKTANERLEVYEDWDRGYLIYKQVNYETVPGSSDNKFTSYSQVSISITAVPIRSDWPPKQEAESPK